MPITSIVSLNQIITWFEDFQQNHYFLNDFGFGEPYDIGTSRQMDFPYMWVALNEDNNIATGTNVKSAIPDLSFSIMFMDKINIQENYLDQNGFQSDNSQEILSDTLQCLQDLITMIQQNWGQYGVLISQDVSFYPAVDETTDKATGVVGRFVLRTRQVNCVIPESPNTIVVQPNQPTYATLLTCENLIDCSTFKTYAYTGGTLNNGTLTISSLNGNTFSVTGFTGGGGGGSNGTSGSSGVSGSSGTSGSSGANGTSGSSGQNGATGTSGSSGVSGVSGSGGTSGSSGINGDAGTSGSSGSNGAAGSTGANGTNGTSGSSGSNGASGVPGTSGTSGSSGANGISAGQTYYLNESQNSDVSGYKVLSTEPSTATTQTLTTNLTGNQQNVLVSDYITPQLGFNVIPGGVQRFHLHYLKQASNDDIDAYVQIQLADSSGTPIGPTISSNIALIGWVSSVIPVEVNLDIVIPTTTIDPTNRMIVRLYLSNNDSTSHSVVYYTEGNSYYSFVVTSVGAIAGSSGSSGSSGQNGTSGSSGASGINGTSGSNGLSGVDGTSGSSGVNGAGGTSGSSGANGTSGSSGANGTSGSSGINGEAGTSGSSGVSGSQGIAGTAGSSGVSGTAGTSGTSPTGSAMAYGSFSAPLQELPTSPTIVPLDTTGLTSNMYLSSNAIVVPTAGVYRVAAFYYVDLTSTGYALLQLVINGTGIADYYTTVTTSENINQSIEKFVSLSANDTVSFNFARGGGASLGYLTLNQASVTQLA